MAMRVTHHSRETRAPACSCCEAPELVALLAGQNGVLAAWDVPGGARVPSMYVRRLDPSGPLPPPLVPSYCPFCGDRYGGPEPTS